MPMPTIEQFDALKEIVNIGVGRAASALNEMLDAHIELKVPTICFFNLKETDKIPKHLQIDQLSCVQMGFKGSFNGKAALVFPPESYMRSMYPHAGHQPLPWLYVRRAFRRFAARRGSDRSGP